MRGFPLWSFVSATVRRLSSSIFFLLFGFVFFFNTVTTGQGRTTKRVISWATDRLVISLITEPRLKKNVRHLLFVFQKNQNGRRQNRGGGLSLLLRPIQFGGTFSFSFSTFFSIGLFFFLSFLPSRRIVPILNSFNFRSYSYFFTVFFVNRLTYSY